MHPLALRFHLETPGRFLYICQCQKRLFRRSVESDATAAPHEDHIGGLDYVINSFQIGKIYMPKVTSNMNTFEDVITAIKNKGMQIKTPIPGASFKLGDATCTILAPYSRSYDDLNNYSIVIKN